MVLRFENRYQLINYYKQKQFDADQDLQDWLVHYEAKKLEKINATMKVLRDCQDLIDWNRSELRREGKKVDGLGVGIFRRDSPKSSSFSSDISSNVICTSGSGVSKLDDPFIARQHQDYDYYDEELDDTEEEE